MLEYLSGRITELNPALAIVECGGVGYAAQISLQTYGQLAQGEERLIYVHPVYREDTQLLFGFADKSERQVFRLLISVSGIGPNTARLILSSLNAEEVSSAIQSGDVMRFKSVKGVGAKTAQRLIVDLRDKMGSVEVIEGLGTTTDLAAQALDALVVLGYARPTAEKAVAKARRQKPDAALEELIKIALQTI